MPTNNTHARRSREIARLLVLIQAQPEHSDERVSQIISNALGQQGDIYYVEDSRLLHALEAYYKKVRR